MTSDVCYYDFMKETLEAVYENGVFRPLTRPEGLAEHRRVMLTVTAEEAPSSLTGSAGSISADDAREMREIIEREFERVDPREWQ
jgi:predicted DNA-binding antitoxin AbrB/MazE fold protein